MEEDAEKEEEILSRIDEIGAEFVRLILGDLTCRGAMGPWDDHQESAQTGPPPSQAAKQVGVMLRDGGDELFRRNPNLLDEAVLPVVARGVLQVTQDGFSSICDKFLQAFEPKNGGEQVAAVFRVSTELIRCLRSKSSYPRGRESTIIRYAGRYLVAIGLAVDLQRVLHQATDGGVTEDALSFSPVEIPK